MDIDKFQPTETMRGDDARETSLLRSMFAHAMAYLQGFDWCQPIVNSYLGFGVGEVIALFLFKFNPPIADGDEWLWVVVGDLPSAYFVTDEARTRKDALEVYCGLMESWSESVLRGTALDGLFPVNVSSSIEHAEMLRNRIRFIRDELIPRVE